MKYLAFMLLLSCGRPSTITVDADKAAAPFTEAAVEAINVAMGEVIVKFGRPGLRISFTGMDLCATYQEYPPSVLIGKECAGYDDMSLGQAVIHEIGHAFGLDHSSDRKSVMWHRLVTGRTLKFSAESLIHELAIRGWILLPPNDQGEIQ